MRYTCWHVRNFEMKCLTYLTCWFSCCRMQAPGKVDSGLVCLNMFVKNIWYFANLSSSYILFASLYEWLVNWKEVKKFSSCKLEFLPRAFFLCVYKAKSHQFMRAFLMEPVRSLLALCFCPTQDLCFRPKGNPQISLLGFVPNEWRHAVMYSTHAAREPQHRPSTKNLTSCFLFSMSIFHTRPLRWKFMIGVWLTGDVDDISNKI